MMSRSFLRYHGDKFLDQSLMIKVEGELVAVFPAASYRKDINTVISHPGASYGGLSYLHNWGGAELVDIGTSIAAFYRDRNIESMFIKVKPSIYSDPPGSEDLYVWWRNGAVIERVDLSNVIEARNFNIGTRRRRTIKKLQKSQIQIHNGLDQLPKVYDICATNLHERHGVAPVHSLEDLKFISSSLPSTVRVSSCMIDGEIESGLILFVNQNAAVVQYWGSTKSGRSINALDPLVLDAISWCVGNNITWFVPGISTNNAGLNVDRGIYEYKVSLGSGTISQTYLKIKL